MSLLNIALLQMMPHGDDKDANQAKGETFCRRARDMGADIALFPEMWSNGYAHCPTEEDARKTWQAQAIGRDSGFVTRFQELAKELNMAIALTYLEEWDGAPRNTVSLIDRHGEIAMTYAKVHTCDFSDEAACTPGEEFHVCNLDTDAGPVKIGAMICYDREFPESARILMLQGAEVILTPNACELEDNRMGQFKARAYENMAGLAMANYAAPKCNGHSVAFDGMAFAGPPAGSEDGASRDMLIIEAGEREGVYLAEFNLDQLRAYRQRETWGNAFRKPRSYGHLTSPEVKDPFIRKSARR